MKQVSLILNLILSISVATLFYLHFSDKKADEKAIVANATPNQEIKNSENTGTIAYVNQDTLWAKYKLILDLEAELASEQRKSENYLSEKGRKLQEDAYQLQLKASQMNQGQLILAQDELQQTQMELESRQQELMMSQQRMEQDLFSKQQTMGIQVRDELNAELKKYCDEKGFKMILAYSSISDLLYADANMEVTTELVERLNTAYESKNQAEEATE